MGENNHGQLGLNQTNNLELSSPAQILGTTWSSVAGLGNRVLALKTNGTLWSWGYNEVGQTGSNDRTKRSSPNQVGTDTSWSKLPVAGQEDANGASAAIKTDGTLWVWGDQYFYGQLGLNQVGATGGRYSSPTQLPGTTWSNVATGKKATMATKTDGTLWVMGTNEFGTLGQNEGPGSTSGARSSPTQIPGTTWDGTQMRIPSNGEGMKAMKTDGTLWVWGAGGGWMGLNSEVQRSSPTQVPGTWEAIGGGTATLGLKA